MLHHETFCNLHFHRCLSLFFFLFFFAFANVIFVAVYNCKYRPCQIPGREVGLLTLEARSSYQNCRVVLNCLKHPRAFVKVQLFAGPSWHWLVHPRAAAGETHATELLMLLTITFTHGGIIMENSQLVVKL